MGEKTPMCSSISQRRFLEFPVFTVTPSSKPFNKFNQESKRQKKMNIQRFRAVQRFVQEIFEEIFYSNLQGFAWGRHVCIPLRGTNPAARS